MKILGLTAPMSWNSAAAIVVDGKLVAAVEEERFNGLKHSPRIIPLKSIEYCLKQANIQPNEIDAIAFGYRHPIDYYIRSFAENLKVANLKRGIREMGAFAEYYVGLIRLFDWLTQKGFKTQGSQKLKTFFIPHHLAHAASAFYCSGFKEANIITLDGQGEEDSGSIWIGNSKGLKKIKSISSNQSLGWVYESITNLIGFKPHSHEGKTMGLAAWGTKKINYQKYWQITSDGYHLLPHWKENMFEKYGPQRSKDQPLTDVHRNLAYTVQSFTQKAGQSLAKWAYKQNPSHNLCLAGGVALNCDMNSQIWKLPFIKNIFIQPASSDAGTAIGAAMEVSNRLGEKSNFKMTHAYWGPEFSNKEIEIILKGAKIKYQKVDNIDKEVAKLLSQGKIVSWFQGRMEIGPRALGNRSILGHPGLKGMKDKINNEVKHREDWRPFAPSILDEAASQYFEKYCTHPFMILGFDTNKKGQKDLSQGIHIDKTARIQSVVKKDNPLYHSMINEFAKITGIPAVINTSFNDAEQPLVCTPKEALKTFFGTGLDYLAIGNFLVEKPKKI
ncbi:MAG: carbamoyltransferase C-terminal domain-containing protein [Candidatus Shapirobacteria bacterium]|nr:carbamoyltransferase C-terminal domain-containing protein [Candidatus Shapirobacteria bacterium]